MMEKRGSCMGAMGTAHNRSAPWEATHSRRRTRIYTACSSTWGGSVVPCAIIRPRDPPALLEETRAPILRQLIPATLVEVVPTAHSPSTSGGS